jgi:hypothetical protein
MNSRRFIGSPEALGHGIVAAQMKLVKGQPMSALGQKQTFAVHQPMSALPPKADMCSALGYVRFGPIPDLLAQDRVPRGFSPHAWKSVGETTIVPGCAK